jgi:hypothetical protein
MIIFRYDILDLHISSTAKTMFDSPDSSRTQTSKRENTTELEEHHGRNQIMVTEPTKHCKIQRYKE